MKILFTTFSLLVCVICFSQTSDKAWETIDQKTYTIQLPPDWTTDKTKQMGTDLILFSGIEDDADKFRENVNILIQNLKGRNLNLDKYSKMSEKQIKDYVTDAEIFESRKVKLNNREYYKMVYSGTQGVYKLKFEQYYYVVKDTAYVITFTTEFDKFEAFKAAGEQILNSFTLK